MESRCEYIEQAVDESRQGVVPCFGVGRGSEKSLQSTTSKLRNHIQSLAIEYVTMSGSLEHSQMGVRVA